MIAGGVCNTQCSFSMGAEAKVVWVATLRCCDDSSGGDRDGDDNDDRDDDNSDDDKDGGNTHNDVRRRVHADAEAMVDEVVVPMGAEEAADEAAVPTGLNPLICRDRQ
jgi:hypothetical protein